MKRIIYLSSGIRIFLDVEINELLNVSRRNNTKNSVTGLLLYSDGNFCKLLRVKMKCLKSLILVKT